MYGAIYKINNQVNGKIYIGQTTMSATKRFRCHIDNARKRRRLGKSLSPIEAALLKYSIEMFKLIILEYCQDQGSLNQAEKRLIEHFNCYSPDGYNIREGGSRGKLAESTKEKLRYPRKPETRQRMSNAAKGKRVSLKALEALEEGRKSVWLKRSGTGEKNVNAKLTDGQVIEIRGLYASGQYSEQELGDMFGVKQVTVSTILTRKRWQHLS